MLRVMYFEPPVLLGRGVLELVNWELENANK